jgi:hypothetical protein
MRAITTLLIIVFPIIALILQLILKPFRWLTFFKILFVWNTVFFIVHIIVNLSGRMFYYFDLSQSGWNKLVTVTLLFIIATIVTFTIDSKQNNSIKK